MPHKGAERGECKRFVVPGATVHYKKERFFFKRKFTDNYFPMLDISLGGCNFLSQRPLEATIKVSLKIVPPGEEDTEIILKGRVNWVSPNPGE